jgi:DNA-binding PadR family transcriptional regulator
VPIVQESKRRILRELAIRQMHGYELAKRLNLPISGIYQHLRDLSDDRLVLREKKGRRVVYALTKKGKTLLDVLEDYD